MGKHNTASTRDIDPDLKFRLFNFRLTKLGDVKVPLIGGGTLFMAAVFIMVGVGGTLSVLKLMEIFTA